MYKRITWGTLPGETVNQRNKIGKYYITVTATADGGATHTTDPIELDVYCGPSSHTFNFPTPSPQEREVAITDEGFEYGDITKNYDSDCTLTIT